MAQRRFRDSVPISIEEEVRSICLTLPGVAEDQPWVGARWSVRKRTFAHVLGIEETGSQPVSILVFRASGDELAMLANAGFPYFMIGWGRNAMAMVLDDNTEWKEVRERIVDSFCVMAPEKLGAQVQSNL
jgi:hypothetical protein